MSRDVDDEAAAEASERDAKEKDKDKDKSRDKSAEKGAPIRVDWETGGGFVTPPGLWHSHHNESGTPAHLLPVQDAGLHTYLRTLDIRFSVS